MLPGKVVRFRLMPKDCLSVLDVLEKAGLDTSGKSFNTLAHLALSSMLETFRQAGTIDRDPDPFKFAERMFPFSGSTNMIGRRKVTNELRSAALQGFTKPSTLAPTIGLEDAKRELSELEAVGFEALNETQQERYKELCNLVFQ